MGLGCQQFALGWMMGPGCPPFASIRTGSGNRQRGAGTGRGLRGEQPQELHTGTRSWGLIFHHGLDLLGPGSKSPPPPPPQISIYILGGCAPPPPPSLRAPGGWDAAMEGRNAQGEFHSAAQAARAWADGDFDADHGFGLSASTEWAARPTRRPIRAGRAARPAGRRRRLCARSCCINPLHTQKRWVSVPKSSRLRWY
jgi:hypothetical protein